MRSTSGIKLSCDRGQKSPAPVFPHAAARNHAGVSSWEAIDAT